MLIPTADPEFKSGFVALVGRPNVGKSTLMNALIGQKIAITSPVAQTTRNRLQGILTLDRAQIILVDTPGIHKPHHLLGEVIVGNAKRAIATVDLVVWLVDSNAKLGKGDRFIADLIQKAGTPVLLGLNKIDQLIEANNTEQENPGDLGDEDVVNQGDRLNTDLDIDQESNATRNLSKVEQPQVLKIESPKIESEQYISKAADQGLANQQKANHHSDQSGGSDHPVNLANPELETSASKENSVNINNSDQDIAVNLDHLDQIETCRSYLDYADHLGWDTVKFSALTKQGLDQLLDAICDRLEPGPYYYPPDLVTDQPERFIMGELIREQILFLTREEVPHSVAVGIDRVDELEHITRVMATIYVERKSQKGILIGKGGQMLKQIGSEARQQIQKMIMGKVHLELFVKVQSKWRSSRTQLMDLGYRTDKK